MNAPLIIDRRNIAMGHNRIWETRPQNVIGDIAVHHSGTVDGNTAAFERHWATLNWWNGGYTFVVLRDGRIEWNYPYTVVTNGVVGHNRTTLNICVVGNGQFTPAQETSLEWLLRREMNTLKIPVNRVKGHNEFSGQATACPGRNMNTLRTHLRQPVAPPTVASNTHTVRAGETLWGISQQHNTTVQAIQTTNNMNGTNIFPGQVLRLPGTGLTTGQRVQVSNAPLFANATTNTQSGTRSGTFFIWDATINNGRVRVTNQANRVSVAGQVTGWMRVIDL